MKKVNLNFLFPLLALVLLIFALSRPLFKMPPLGKLLDPFIGAVQNGEDRKLNRSRMIIDDEGLKDSVSVFFDERKVPHIYAKNETDIYFAQGYVTASLRLWEMDFLSYISAGRLCEIFSDEYLEFDRYQRRLGTLSAAKASLAMIEKDPESGAALTAYSRGVNAYISQLNYKQYPLEYKILDYTPEPWSNLKTVLIMKYMGATLSGYNDDFNMTNMMLALGEENFNKLFPDFHSSISPVVSDSGANADPSLAYLKKPDYLDYSFLSSGTVASASAYNPRLGSNSWVVSGKKTKSGYPILCNDPHLDLSLPSIWMEMQLTCPGMNVYGVSIPGTPAIIIGFNENIAWGLTNGQDDVFDWYKLKVTDDYSKYEFDGEWRSFDSTIEKITIRNSKPFYDTIHHTVHGPLVNTRRFAHKPEHIDQALRWELNKPSNEFITFIQLNKAKNHHEYREAIKHYACPVQNFTFACKDNTIAVNHQGNLAVKWPGQGKFILDGTVSSHLYTRYIPDDSLPQVLNPACNYLVSANQHPTFAGYPYYYNGHYSETRANRIAQILNKENDFDIPRMKSMQLDNVNFFAVEALPVLMESMATAKLSEEEKKALGLAGNWKGNYDYGDQHAKLFELWWDNIREYTWDELKAFSFYSKPPEDYILLQLIRNDPANSYFDKQGTTIKETANDIIREAFTAATAQFNKSGKEGNTKWSDFNKVTVMHLMNVKAFSKVDMPSAGYPDAINATSAGWGPSWRMIVELGDRPKAFGIYAGGQSGNTGSSYYDNFINDWNKGVYYPLNFFISETEARGQATASWIFKQK